ncbi:hypothetical protein [Micromonospora sp. WMMD737]|uniref:hypothetical protein n=1 Tax=Micromonospora sp. WMMD737 TaxID=3404113 RepID=UPI003B92BE88
MKRRVRAAAWLFARSRAARLAFVAVTFPYVFVTDRRGPHGRLLNPSTFREAIASAWRGGWDLPDTSNPPPDGRR